MITDSTCAVASESNFKMSPSLNNVKSKSFGTLWAFQVGHRGNDNKSKISLSYIPLNP